MNIFKPLALTLPLLCALSHISQGQVQAQDPKKIKAKEKPAPPAEYTLTSLYAGGAYALTAGGNSPQNTKFFYTIQDAKDTILVTANISKNGKYVAPSDLPAGYLKWSEGVPVKGDPTQVEVGKAKAKKVQVTATVGNTSKTVVIYVIWVTRKKLNSGPESFSKDNLSALAAKEVQEGFKPGIFSDGKNSTSVSSKGTITAVTEEQFTISPAELITDEASGLFDKGDKFEWDLKRLVKGERWYGYAEGSWSVENKQKVQASGIGESTVLTSDEWANDDDPNYSGDEDLDPWNYAPVPGQPDQSGNGNLYAVDPPEIALNYIKFSKVSKAVIRLQFKTWAELNGQKCSDDYFWNIEFQLNRKKDDPEIDNNGWNISTGTISSGDTFAGATPPNILPESAVFVVGTPVNVALTASGIQGEYEVIAKNFGPFKRLPNGLSIVNNVLIGTPTTVETQDVPVWAYQKNGTSPYITKEMTIKVKPAP